MVLLYPSAQHRGLVLVLAVVAWMGLCGCSSQPRLYPVKGKVTYKDSGKPMLPGGTVMFELVGNPSRRASGDLEQDGSFSLGTTEGPGTVAGDYRILIIPPNPESGGRPLHPKYQKYDTSGLTFTVKPQQDNYCEIKVERPSGR
jgi:hypothetical protein